MAKNRKKNDQGKIARLLLSIFLALAGLALLVKVLLHGHNIALFHPKGLIAQQQLDLALLTVGIMLIIAIPALSMFFYTAWKYRETNTKAVHDPNVKHSKWLVAGIWFIPLTFAVVLASIMWPAAHRLAPQKAIKSDKKPLTIQVISMRWKWLFIYPEQKIATVNFVQIPKDTPVEFKLTADDAPMSAFWVPNLSGMLYTMTGHSNTLNIRGDTIGDFPGRSGEINGAGFAGMKFTTRVSSSEDFDKWVDQTRSSNNVLDGAAYNKLLHPSEDNPVAVYSSAESDLYDKVLMKYMDMESMHMGGAKHE